MSGWGWRPELGAHASAATDAGARARQQQIGRMQMPGTGDLESDESPGSEDLTEVLTPCAVHAWLQAGLMCVFHAQIPVPRR